MRILLIPSLLAISVLACTSSPPPPQTLALAECTSGWWMDSASTACTTYCYKGAPMPECNQSDCVARAVAGYLSNAQLVGAVILYSPKSATLSSAGPPTTQTFAIDASGIKMTPPGNVLAAECKTSGLSVTYTNYVRPTAGMSVALDGAAAGSTSSRWTAVSVPK